MTIIAYDVNTDCVSVDSHCVYFNGRAPVVVDKIFRQSSNGIVFTLCGNEIPIRVVADAILREFEHDGPSMRIRVDGFASDVTISGIGRLADGTVVSIEFGHDYVDIIRLSHSCVYYAIGAGADWYNAYRAIGLPHLAAMDNVAAQHSMCGGAIQHF